MLNVFMCVLCILDGWLLVVNKIYCNGYIWLLSSKHWHKQNVYLYIFTYISKLNLHSDVKKNATTEESFFLPSQYSIVSVSKTYNHSCALVGLG